LFQKFLHKNNNFIIVRYHSLTLFHEINTEYMKPYAQLIVVIYLQEALSALEYVLESKEKTHILLL